MKSMHTFSNEEYDKNRQELLNRKTHISVSDVSNNFDIKNKLHKDHFVDGEQDQEEIYTCKICFLIIKDPKECSECSALFCS